MIAGHGDSLPVSALPADGTYPDRHGAVGEAQHRAGDPGVGRGGLHPVRQVRHGLPARVIRIKVYDADSTWPARRRRSSRATRATASGKGLKYTLQVAPEDCTGCGICVDICPAKNKSETRLKAINMRPQPPLREPERANWDFFLTLPEIDRRRVKAGTIRQQQVQEPLFEFSGACAGCGETPYIKLRDAAVRRPHGRRQRHRLLVDLRRQPADHAVDAERRGPRPGLVQLAVRGQRRVRARLPPVDRQADGVRRASC